MSNKNHSVSTEKSAKKNISVFIDADNVSANKAKVALYKIARRGKILSIKAFGNFCTNRSAGAWKDVSNQFGVQLDQRFSNSTSKNSSDIAMVIEATSSVFRGWGPDAIAIVSSDSDFLPLVHFAKEYGLEVIGAGEDKAPESYRRSCSHWLTLSSTGGDHAAA